MFAELEAGPTTNAEGLASPDSVGLVFFFLEKSCASASSARRFLAPIVRTFTLGWLPAGCRLATGVAGCVGKEAIFFTFLFARVAAAAASAPPLLC